MPASGREREVGQAKASKPKREPKKPSQGRREGGGRRHCVEITSLVRYEIEVGRLSEMAQADPAADFGFEEPRIESVLVATRGIVDEVPGRARETFLHGILSAAVGGGVAQVCDRGRDLLGLELLAKRARSSHL